MIRVRKVDQVVHLFHPTRPDRRATFVRLGGEVRYTIRGASGRRQTTMTLEAARRRWAFLKKLGYLRWEELPPVRQPEERT